jgi:hypothetical protein
MAVGKKAIQARTGIARATAWLILIIWGGWWVLFGVAAGLGSYSELGQHALLQRLVMPVLIVLALIICWRREIFGSLLLIAVVAFCYWYTGLYQPSDNPVLRNLLLITFTIPPLLGALLLMLCGVTTWRMSRTDDD